MVLAMATFEGRGGLVSLKASAGHMRWVPDRELGFDGPDLEKCGSR